MANDKDFKVKNGIQPTVYHEGVGTVVSGSEGYSLSSASYDSKSFSVASQDTNPYGCFFKPDGTKMYMVGDINNSVYQYSLSTSWDVSTASYDSVIFSIGSQEALPTGIFFKPDGSKMYISGQGGDDLNQYSLSTAWDISTASYDNKTLLLNQSTNPYGCFFKPDGTKFYSVDVASNTVYQYSLSTAWDVSTGSYDSVSFSVSTQETGATLLYLNDTGSIMYVGGQITDSLYEYTLSTAWDVSTSTYSGTSFSLASQEIAPTGIFFKPDGTKMYMVGLGNDTIYQYSTVQTTNTLDLSTGSVFEITPTSDIQVGLSNPAASGTVSQATLLLDGGVDPYTAYKIDNISYDSKSLDVSTQETNASSVQFNTSGTKAFVLGYAGDDINQYSLSTAWDISTGSFDSVTFSVSAQQSTPTSFIFKSDGTKFYVLGYGTAAVHQYDLTSAFDLSTASYASKTFSISQDATPVGLEFKPDGTKMYVVGFSNDTIYQYALSTAFDVSTASYESKSFSVTSQQPSPREFKFNSGGTKFILCGDSSDYLYQYSCSTAYDISTASYDSVSYSINSIEPWSSTGSTTYGLTFKDDGSKLYLVDTTGTDDGVFQYSTATPATITYPSTLEFSGGTAPTSPAIGETDVITFSTTDGGTSYQAVQAIDGAK